MTRPNNLATNYSYDNLSGLLSVLHQAGSATLDNHRLLNLGALASPLESTLAKVYQNKRL